MRHDILVFDLDGTLCPVGKGMLPEDAALLCKLEDCGFTIVVCSGKTTFYLCGFLRQVGLKNPVMIGENGGAVQFGIDLPPVRFAQYPVDPAQKELLGQLRREIDAVCGDRVWYQPNEMQLTPFPRDAETYEKIREVLESHRQRCSAGQPEGQSEGQQELQDAWQGLQIYYQSDCVDIVPSGINKENGLRFLSGLLEADPARFLAVGDGVNDIPMFAFADFSILVHSETGMLWRETDVDMVMPTIGDAMRYILENER